MTISKERLNILRQTFKAAAKTSEALEAAALNDAAIAISELLAVREAQSVPAGKFAGWGLYHAGRDDFGSWLKHRPEDENGDALTKHGYVNVKLFTAPLAPAVPADYQHLKHVSESYFAVEKRLFDLAQRLKGPSFDHYAYSLHQAIDVLDKEIFGESEDNSAALAAAPTPTKAVPCGSDCATLNVDRKTYGKAFRVVESDDDQG